MSEVARQVDRIAHLVRMTGITPTVLDVPKATMDALVAEGGGDAPTGFYKGRMTVMSQCGKVELVVEKSA